LAVVAAGEASSRLGVLPGFLPIALHDLLGATDDGFRSKVSGFLLLRLPIVHFALLSVVFCLNFSPLFFLLLFPCQVFFLPLFIYLLRNL
jgi:hypothetical protein